MSTHCMSTCWGRGGEYSLLVSTISNGKPVESLILSQNYMHDISSVDLPDEKDQVAVLLVGGKSALYASVIDGIHLSGFGTLNESKLCLRRVFITLNGPVNVMCKRVHA